MSRWLVGLVAALCLSGCHRQAKPETLPKLIVERPSEEASTVGSSVPASSTPGLRRPATPRERATIEKLARAAESVRQLRFESPIAIEIEDGIAIASSLRDQIDDEELERARLLYGALGLIDPDADLRALFSGILGEQVIGYYDPKATRLVVRDDVMDGLLGTLGPAETQEARLVLVHELVHALQDQRLGLGESYDQKRTADADNAFRAVIEGDATLAMLANALRSQGIPLSAATQRIQQMGSYLDVNAFVRGEKLDEAPAISDRLAPEHLEIATADADALAARINDAGAIFVGRYTPEVIGDYVAGTNHVLPTARSARFASGLGVLDFMKRTSILKLDAESLKTLGPAAMTLARAEGLEAHRRSVAIRLNLPE